MTPHNSAALDTAGLRAKAEAATAGSWRTGTYPEPLEVASPGQVCIDIGHDTKSVYVLASCNENFPREAKANATYIAAANPSVILALLDERDHLLNSIDRAERTLRMHGFQDNGGAEWEPPNAAAAAPGERATGVHGQAYGIVDPDYARYYSIIRCTAWQYGYAIGMHGSFTRDLDLIAVPWAENVCAPEKLVKVICGRTGLTEHHKNPTEKPHGRLAFTLMLPGFGDPRWVDLSIVPVATPRAQDAGATGDPEQ